MSQLRPARRRAGRPSATGATLAPAAEEWRNWAGTQRCLPGATASPVTLDDVVSVVGAAAASGRRAKVVGSGHSFTGAAVTDGVAIHLGRHCRVLDVDADTGLATVEAGMTLARLNKVLAAAGLALPNLGDIDAQSLAGALATGTHGTGAAAGSLAAQVVGLQIVTADGEVRSCSPERDRELFEAARVSLGALGVITAVTLQAVPAFSLRAQEAVEPLERVLAGLDHDVAANDHFEFYWVPHTDLARTKRNNRSDEAPRGGRMRRFADRVLLENVAFGGLCRVERRWPELTPRLAPVMAAGGNRDIVDRSYRIFASPRLVPFVEMEYALPRAAAGEALGRIRDLIEREALRVAFPIEVRFAPAEEVWLSTSHGRDSCYVAVHQFQGMPYRRYFDLVEEVMVNLDGRPHWGKLHTRSAADLAPHYPQWSRWQDQRSRVDPDGMWGNDYLAQIFDPRPPA
ncbi:FAD-binding protein [Acidiferrimicrobium sp. IK]|uniref:D-arabinono-1,4-lactone oxidase n=1 Tax=Acidiferrimicrobium sp. IK TaxID=2871700 RepID=UPI0021CB32B7|nr:D-arabinono-1,4-lactone oxidase [Acidiferrimicrobium sp. IK]MCU4185810.1 FAD-binding protein [Acidiferrimicrobium sp. IK]